MGSAICFLSVYKRNPCSKDLASLVDTLKEITCASMIFKSAFLLTV